MSISSQKHGVTSSGYHLIPTRLGLLHLREEGNSQDSLNHIFWDDLTLLYVGQLSWSNPGFTADLEGACGC